MSVRQPGNQLDLLFGVLIRKTGAIKISAGRHVCFRPRHALPLAPRIARDVQLQEPDPSMENTRQAFRAARNALTPQPTAPDAIIAVVTDIAEKKSDP